MFGVMRNDFFIEDVDMHGYLEWVVQKEYNDYTVFPPIRKRDKLGFHKCNDTDEFSPAHESQEQYLKLLKATLYCIDDIEQIYVSGSKMSEFNDNVSIELHRCVGEEHCKDEAEFNEFLQTYNLFGIMYNTQTYEPNTYNENVIDYKLKGEVRPITLGGSRIMRQFNFKKETLESAHDYAGHGFFPDERTFYTFYETDEKHISEQRNSLGGILIGTSLDVVHHTRSIYTMFEVLEEFGGIYSILYVAGFGIVLAWEFCFGSKTKAFLVRHIFKQSALQRRGDTLDCENS